MAEPQKIFNIEKQEPQRDLYNIAGNLIINPLTQEPVYFPTIQSVLRKGETTDGDFFKKEPEWVDYEQGFIVERKEVDEIIKKLENNKVQLALGAPASGKSIILKNVGYKLAKENKTVYVVELKKHPQDEIKLFFENIPKMNHENPIFIVDDAHLYLSDCERLIRNFRSNGKGNLIIGSRETRGITEEHPKECAEYELLSVLSKNAIHVQAEDVTEGMIRTFLEQYRFDEDKIKIISFNLNIYKFDLWFLSWALKAYNKDKESVVIDEIYEKITSSIKKIKVGKEKEAINAEDIFLPISIFFRFEIPIEQYFLEEELDIDGKIINQLIGLQEIVEMEDTGKHKMLSLNHSSIAKLYFGAYQNLPDLGRKTKKNILYGKNEKDLEFCLFYRYITTTPRNAFHVLVGLSRDWGYRKGREKLIKRLIKIDKIQKLFVNGIDKEEDIEKIGWCVGVIAHYFEKVGLKLIDSVKSKIDKEKDMGKIGSCVRNIVDSNEKVGLKLVDSVLSKIEREEHIENIGICVMNIADSNEKVAMKLVDSVLSKIDREEHIELIGFCVGLIAFTNEKVGLRLIDSVKSKIDKEKDMEKIGRCVGVIALFNEKVGLKLVDSVLSKIEREGVALIVIDSFLSKTNGEEDIEKIKQCVLFILERNEKVGLKLLKGVLSKIDREDLKRCVKSKTKRRTATEEDKTLNP